MIKHVSMCGTFRHTVEVDVDVSEDGEYDKENLLDAAWDALDLTYLGDVDRLDVNDREIF